MILKPSANFFNSASLIGLASGIFLAIALVSIRRLKATEPTHRILFFYFLFGTLITLPFVILHWVPLITKDIWLLLAVGICMYLGQVLITYSYQHAKASTLSPISYSTILFAGILGFILWGTVPDYISGLGMLLVITGGILSVILEQRSLHKSF